MLSKSDIDKLAELCRLGLTDGEKAGLEKDLSAILGYVTELEKADVAFDDQILSAQQSRNTFREDGEPHAPGKYSEALLSQAPKRSGNYVAVKPIIEK